MAVFALLDRKIRRKVGFVGFFLQTLSDEICETVLAIDVKEQQTLPSQGAFTHAEL